MSASQGILHDIMFFFFSAAGLLLLFILARHIGTLHHHWVLKHRPERRSPATDSTGYLVSSALALLGLLIGFTFSMAVQRYDERRHAVNAEANAISTVYARAGLFEEPIASRLQSAVARYAVDRRDFVKAGENAAALDAAARDANDAQNKIWAIMKEALSDKDAQVYATSTLASMNEMFDLAATRQALIEAHLPIMVMAVLIGFALATAYLLGYGSAHERQNHNAAMTIVFALVATAIALIFDLDRPRLGFIKIDQAPMERIIVSINPPKAMLNGQ